MRQYQPQLQQQNNLANQAAILASVRLPNQTYAYQQQLLQQQQQQQEQQQQLECLLAFQASQNSQSIANQLNNALLSQRQQQLENEQLKIQLQSYQQQIQLLQQKQHQRDIQLNYQYSLLNNSMNYLPQQNSQYLQQNFNIQPPSMLNQYIQMQSQQQVLDYQNNNAQQLSNINQNFLTFQNPNQLCLKTQQSCSAVQQNNNNIAFKDTQILTLNSSQSPNNYQGQECQFSNKSTVAAEDNSQQISMIEVSASPKINLPQQDDQNLRLLSTKQTSIKGKEEPEELKQKSLIEINSLQKTSSCLSSEEDIQAEAGHEQTSNRSPKNDMNKRTRCLYEPLFRSMSPTLPEKKSYKSHILTYLKSYQQGNEQPNEKTEKFVTLLQCIDHLKLASYITKLLQQSKMAEAKKLDVEAHQYIAKRIFDSLQGKEYKNKVSSKKEE